MPPYYAPLMEIAGLIEICVFTRFELIVVDGRGINVGGQYRRGDD